jgi:hypothetical protein
MLKATYKQSVRRMDRGTDRQTYPTNPMVQVMRQVRIEHTTFRTQTSYKAFSTYKQPKQIKMHTQSHYYKSCLRPCQGQEGKLVKQQQRNQMQIQ